MAKGTLILFFLLSIIATLLLGINIGKKIGTNQPLNSQPTTYNLQPTTIHPSPTLTNIPTPVATISAGISIKAGSTTIYNDATCGLKFSYPAIFTKQKAVSVKATILSDPQNPNSALAVSCDQKIPRPPVSSDKIENITLDGIGGLLYHDRNQDGTPRDEVIVKHPAKNLEIIIAGYGPTFQQVISSFRFLNNV